MRIPNSSDSSDEFCGQRLNSESNGLAIAFLGNYEPTGADRKHEAEKSANSSNVDSIIFSFPFLPPSRTIQN